MLSAEESITFVVHILQRSLYFSLSVLKSVIAGVQKIPQGPLFFMIDVG